MKSETQNKQETFHERLKRKMDEYAHFVYKITKKFPKEEIYGVTSQLRRSGLSVILNYIEGYARMRSRVYKNFLQISFGSLKESEYLLKFAHKEGYLSGDDYKIAADQAYEIGSMLWAMISRMK